MFVIRIMLVVVLSGVLHMAVAGEAFAQTGTLPSPASMNAILDSLERVAVTSGDPRERARAALTISGAGRLGTAAPGANNTPPGVRYPGVVARLARIYRQSSNSSVRDGILYWMPAQAERAEAAAFLAEVASEEPQPTQPAPPGVAVVGNDAVFPLPYQAVEALTQMGPEGQAALQRLHGQGSVREPTARMYLDTLANHGFKAPARP